MRKLLYRWWARLLISFLISSAISEYLHLKTGIENNGIGIFVTITLYILLSVVSGILNHAAMKKKKYNPILDEDLNE